MLGLHEGGDAVIDVVIGQDRAQQLLLGLDVVGQDFGVARLYLTMSGKLCSLQSA